MTKDTAVSRLAALLRKLRDERRISKRQLADEAKVNVSIVIGAERGENAKLATWEKLFTGLGYRLDWEVVELAEEIGDLLIEEAERRRERRDAFCEAKRGARREPWKDAFPRP